MGGKTGLNMFKIMKTIDSIAIKALKQSKPVAGIDITVQTLNTELSAARTRILAAETTILQLQTDYANLSEQLDQLMTAFNYHTHNYLDTSNTIEPDGSLSYTQTTRETTTKL